MQELLALVERALGSAWREVVDHLRETNSLQDIQSAIEAGDYASAIEGVEQAAEHFASATSSAYRTAGERASEWLNGEVDDKLISYDATNTAAVRWAEQNRLSMVQGLTAEQRQTMNQILVDAAREGRNPREVARDIRQGLGLTPQQERWVSSYRDSLEAGQYSDALGRELSHGYSDRAIAAAARNRVELTPEQIDLAVDRYRANIVGYRAEVIARTEGLRVVHQGTEDAMKQAVARGLIEVDSLTREWSTAHDGRVRSSHRAMQGQTRKIGESFETGDGVLLRYPGDPAAPASETAQCRCCIGTRYAPPGTAERFRP